MSGWEHATSPLNSSVSNLQHPEDVLYTVNLVTQILSITLVSVFMILRLYARTFIAPPLHADDCNSLFLLPRDIIDSLGRTLTHEQIATMGFNALSLLLGNFGGGYHVYENACIQDQLTSSLVLYALSLVYGPSSLFTKITLLWITMRVFRLHRKTMIGGYAAIILLTCYTILVLCLKAVICRPISGFWDPTIRATCYNQNAIFVADTAVGAISDIFILCLPIPVALNLRMLWHQRLKVIAMLSSGGVATAASVTRLVISTKLQHSEDETIDHMRFNLLGTAEVCIGLMCACLPAINILFMRDCMSLFKSSRNTRSGRLVELKFLRGSKLRTQHVSATFTTEAAPVAGSQDTPSFPALGESDNRILPLEEAIQSPIPPLNSHTERSATKRDG
ncbi:hypothetical protein LZ31DRAFT_483269 [Colletotrichum somersetense]|nr:hypothetical protein LZ31DRAFT_483269 [Colletotrichum somersetense]